MNEYQWMKMTEWMNEEMNEEINKVNELNNVNVK